MPDQAVPTGKFMVNPYLDWAKAEGVPIFEDFGLDLLALETGPWDRYGVHGAIAHVKGRGDFMTVFVLEIPPGGKTIPQKHIFEEACFVLSGHGSAMVEDHAGRAHTFAWGPNSIFAPPLNCRAQFFNGSGQEPVRLAISSNLPAVLNLFHSEAFVFDNPCSFPEREGGDKRTGQPGGQAVDEKSDSHEHLLEFIEWVGDRGSTADAPAVDARPSPASNAASRR